MHICNQVDEVGVEMLVLRVALSILSSNKTLCTKVQNLNFHLNNSVACTR